MSIVEVKVPELSESVSEASLIEWKKKVGEPVKADEILIEIETDKIVLEIPSPADGVLSSIEQPNGASVLSDQLIATVDTEAVASAPKEEAPKAEEAVAVQPAAQAAAAPKAPTVMPAAEKLMANSGIDAGSSRGNRFGRKNHKAGCAFNAEDTRSGCKNGS